jgi:hypothetical protein
MTSSFAWLIIFAAVLVYGCLLMASRCDDDDLR